MPEGMITLKDKYFLKEKNDGSYEEIYQKELV